MKSRKSKQKMSKADVYVGVR